MEKKNLLAIGNIDKSRNITQFGDEIVYGGGTYSAITAQKLGYSSAILTRGNDSLDAWIRELEAMGIEVFLEKDGSTLEVVNDRTSGVWIQRILTTTGKINFDLEKKFDIIHVNPLFKEVDQELLRKARRKCGLLSLDIQGILRNERNGVMYLEKLDDREAWLEGVDIVHLSDAESNFVSEKSDPEGLCEDLKSLGPRIVLYTMGAAGSYVLGREFNKIPAFKVKEIDPTGAGDVYSIAFDIIYSETKHEKAAALYSSAAASFCVEGFGYRNIQPRHNVEARFKQLTKLVD
jgi:sugar/nucleoside kinase (ribokinase family)